MNYKSESLILIALCLCSSMSLWAQGNTTDNRLFTIQPNESIALSQAANATTVAIDASALPAAAKQPVIMNFDKLPNNDWLVFDCFTNGTGTVSHGILTVDSPNSCYEYILYSPKGIWNKYVSNSRGWIIETSLKVDPITQPGSVEIWANDHKILIIVYFNTDEIYIAYPDRVHFPMNTTDGFHVYRIEAKGMHVKIYVDGSVAIDHMLSSPGLGTEALVFGDGDLNGTSLTRWDYFSYNVFP